MVGQVEEVDGVDGLLHRHHQVDHAEVVLEAVADEDTPAVHQEPEVPSGITTRIITEAAAR